MTRCPATDLRLLPRRPGGAPRPRRPVVGRPYGVGRGLGFLRCHGRRAGPGRRPRHWCPTELGRRSELGAHTPSASATCSRWRSARPTARFTPGQNRAASSSPGTAVTGRSSRRCRRSRRGAGGAFHHGRGLTTSAGSRPIPTSPSACSSGSSSAESCTARMPAAASPTTGPGQSAMRTASPGIRRSRGAPIRPQATARPGALDGGVSWQAVDTGRDLRYCWALAVDPADPDRWYVSAASGPRAAHAGEDAAGRLYVWEDGAWRALDLPGTSMPYALAAWDAELLAAMADGRILHSADRGETWVETGVRIGSVLAMAVAGDPRRARA